MITHAIHRTPSATFAICALLLTVSAIGCGRPTMAERPLTPSEVTNFDELFAKNCSGCHGAEGNLGPAPPLNDPLFLAIIPEAEFSKTVREGRQGTLMPAFARSSGGMLTDEQVSIVVAGVREKWSKPVDIPKESIPPYLTPADTQDTHTLANREAGLQVFGLACGNCHGERGEGGKEAGALRDASFLSLVSDQSLRRIVITGRSDLGMPNFDALGKMLPAGQPLTNQQVSDVVALLASWRKPHSEAKK